MNRRFLFAALAGALWLAGCASAPRPSTHAAPGAPAAPVPTISLAEEQRRLADLFRGTPVVIEMTSEGSLRVEVPLQFSFDKGRAVVKPPLAKVLDHVAASARSPGLRARISAPGDTLLARDRAASTRDYLVGKGVPATHFAGVGPSPGDAIEIVVGRL